MLHHLYDLPTFDTKVFHLVSDLQWIKQHFWLNKWLIQPYLSLLLTGIQDALRYYGHTLEKINGRCCTCDCMLENQLSIYAHFIIQEILI